MAAAAPHRPGAPRFDGLADVGGAHPEVLADTIASVGVIIGAIVVPLTGWQWVDPLVGVEIGSFILLRTRRLDARVVRIPVRAAPPEVDVEAMERELAQLDDVVDVHDLHGLTLTREMDVVSAHLVVGGRRRRPLRARPGPTVLADRCGITPRHRAGSTRHHGGRSEVTW